jgi:hypothetical protein
MTQRTLGEIANSSSGREANGSRATSTFDRLLREYFARLLVGEFQQRATKAAVASIASDTRDPRQRDLPRPAAR